jgi:adenylate kinase family enzyme
VRRVSIVGPSGSGKSTLARRLGERLGVPSCELDAIHHLPGWTPIDPAEFVRRLDEITAGDGWVIDGNYREVVREGVVWQRADTVVWFDLPRRVVMRQVVGRTVGRVTRREELWNGNREHWTNLFRWDPDRSIIRWAWTTHRSTIERYRALADDPRFAHLEFVRLASRADADAWVESVGG